MTLVRNDALNLALDTVCLVPVSARGDHGVSALEAVRELSASSGGD